jgi:hypothetical protein
MRTYNFFPPATAVTHSWKLHNLRSYSFSEAGEIFTGSKFHYVPFETEGRNEMARYGRAASKSVKSAMHRKKSGTLRSGPGGKGGRVKSRKQAIAIGLSEARKKGAKVPRKKSS